MMITKEIINKIIKLEQSTKEQCSMLAKECKIILDKQKTIRADTDREICQLIDDDVFEKVYDWLEDEYPDFEFLYKERVTSAGIEVFIQMLDTYDSRQWFKISFDEINDILQSNGSNTITHNPNIKGN